MKLKRTRVPAAEEKAVDAMCQHEARALKLVLGLEGIERLHEGGKRGPNADLVPISPVRDTLASPCRVHATPESSYLFLVPITMRTTSRAPTKARPQRQGSRQPPGRTSRLSCGHEVPDPHRVPAPGLLGDLR